MRKGLKIFSNGNWLIFGFGILMGAIGIVLISYPFASSSDAQLAPDVLAQDADQLVLNYQPVYEKDYRNKTCTGYKGSNHLSHRSEFGHVIQREQCTADMFEKYFPPNQQSWKDVNPKVEKGVSLTTPYPNVIGWNILASGYDGTFETWKASENWSGRSFVKANLVEKDKNFPVALQFTGKARLVDERFQYETRISGKRPQGNIGVQTEWLNFGSSPQKIQKFAQDVNFTGRWPTYSGAVVRMVWGGNDNYSHGRGFYQELAQPMQPESWTVTVNLNALN